MIAATSVTYPRDAHHDRRDFGHSRREYYHDRRDVRHARFEDRQRFENRHNRPIDNRRHHNKPESRKDFKDIRNARGEVRRIANNCANNTPSCAKTAWSYAMTFAAAPAKTRSERTAKKFATATRKSARPEKNSPATGPGSTACAGTEQRSPQTLTANSASSLAAATSAARLFPYNIFVAEFGFSCGTS